MESRLDHAMAESIRDEETERILSRLRVHNNKLPEDEINEARRHRDWFVPLFIQGCREQIGKLHLRTNPESQLPVDQHSSIPFFSLYLFSEWDVVESVPIILEGLRVPGEGPFELFGDAIHESVPRYLAQFLHEEPDRIDELIRNHEVNTYVRWGSANSYKYLVRDQKLSADDAVRRLVDLFHAIKVVNSDGRAGAGHCYEVCSGILCNILDLGQNIPAAFDGDDEIWEFVDEFIIDRKSAMAPSKSSTAGELTAALEELPPTRMEDTLAELRDWACFQPRHKARTWSATWSTISSRASTSSSLSILLTYPVRLARCAATKLEQVATICVPAEAVKSTNVAA